MSEEGALHAGDKETSEMLRRASVRAWEVLTAPLNVKGRRSAHNVCIVGSGPAGFYTASHILKGAKDDLRLDIYDRLPVPYGLVRYGVAPDHQDVKNVTAQFRKIAEDKRCSFVGNVNVGRDITVAELRRLYSAVIFATGADLDKALGVPGESVPGVHAAREFVGWYNGHPANSTLAVDLSTESAVVFGHGNVALDVARILLSQPDRLHPTDITSMSVATLRQSKIKTVYVVGRRGPLEVAFTIKELREIVTLEGCKTVIDPADMDVSAEDLAAIANDRPRRRLTELLQKTAAESNQPKEGATRTLKLLFKRSPHSFEADANGRLSKVKLEINTLTGGVADRRAVGTGVTETIDAGLAVRSIGYKSIAIPGVPFDSARSIIPNKDGRVVDPSRDNAVVAGMYCSGWIRRGPVGVIATTMADAHGTAARVLEDLSHSNEIAALRRDQLATSLNSSEGVAVAIPTDSIPFDGGLGGAKAVLASRGARPTSFGDYLTIEEKEIGHGTTQGKIREKLLSVDHMIAVLDAAKEKGA